MASNTQFIDVILTENDVSGAKLEYSLIEKHSNIQLKRWLECRGLKQSGNKTELVERVRQCIESRTDKSIPVSIDGGKWYQLKIEEITKSSSSNTASKPTLAPITGWDTFPSVSLPKYFNRGHIHHHIVQSVQFLNQSDSDSDSDIEDLHTAKPMKKGLDFFKSGHVQEMKDCQKNDAYFLKAKVMASYVLNQTYDVMLQLNQTNGFICDASCTCKASAMGRCSHITGVLYALEDYLEKYGPDPATCTSKKCEWNTGRKRQRNPQNISEADYPSIKKKKVDNLIDYDPTPSFPARSPEEAVSHLLSILESGNSKMSMWESLLYRTYGDYHLSQEEINVLKIRLEQFNTNISLSCSKPTEIVVAQGSSEWNAQRRVRVTASISKCISQVKTARTVTNILNSKLWVDSKQTMGMKYGCDNEANAFKDYVTCMSDKGCSITKTGFWVNSAFPQLGASPDGLVFDPNEGDENGLLEIKCPHILKDKSVKSFDTVLTKKQLKSFCIQRIDGKVQLKKTHSYYYQIQTQLGVLDRKWCDLFVWGSKDNYVVLRIKFDSEFWSELKTKLIDFHQQWLVPEYFEMRIPRRLLCVKVE